MGVHILWPKPALWRAVSLHSNVNNTGAYGTEVVLKYFSDEIQQRLLSEVDFDQSVYAHDKGIKSDMAKPICISQKNFNPYHASMATENPFVNTRTHWWLLNQGIAP